MKIKQVFLQKSLETLKTYWELIRIIIPVAIATQFLVEFKILTLLAPSLEPVMALYGLPVELAFAWITGLFIGVMGAVVVIFTLLPASQLSTADVTIFSALLLFAHALPIEQRILQRVGPKFITTAFLRIFGGMIYAMILHQIFELTGIFTDPINPAWIPENQNTGWISFGINTAQTLFWMLLILLTLTWLMEFLKWTGLMNILKTAFAPVFRYSGIHEEAREMSVIGLLLGVSYGGALLIQETKKGNISPRQIFLSCVFMGFAHSIIEDTLIVVAIGADLTSVFVGRIIFAIIATAVIAAVLNFISEKKFKTLAFNAKSLH